MSQLISDVELASSIVKAARALVQTMDAEGTMIHVRSAIAFAKLEALLAEETARRTRSELNRLTVPYE